MRLRRSAAIAGASILAITGALGSAYARRALTKVGRSEPGTITGVISKMGPVAEPEFATECREAEIPAPPTREEFVAFDPAPENPPQIESRVFSYAGRPVHPAAVMELSGELADPLPKIAAIDLEGFTRSNVVSHSVVTEEAGWVCLQDEERCGTGYFGYRSLGRSPTDTWVLWTVSNGGGTGAFENLLFVRLEKDVVTTQTGHRERIVLRCVGEYSLGDRDEGSVRFDGIRVFIGKSRFRAAEVVLTID